MYIVEKEYNVSKIIEFLISAKKKTYAGNAKEEKASTRSKSYYLIYQYKNFKYIDTYFDEIIK